MQSFKQFITEETTQFPWITVNYKFNSDDWKTADYKGKLKVDKITSHLNDTVDDIQVDGIRLDHGASTASVSVYITHKKWTSSQELLKSLLREIQSQLQDYLYTSSGRLAFPDTIQVICHDVPPFLIATKYCHLYFPENRKTFKGLEKLINPEVLRIFPPKNEKPFGLLSILKMTNLVRITREGIESRDFILAFNIIDKHLKDKDILACQEEMLELGLNGYAKF